MSLRRVTFAAAAAAPALAAGPAFASGFGLNLQSAEALGAATAGAQATPATPGNAYFNPANIVGVEGLEGSLTFVGVLNDTSYEDATAALFGTVPVAGDASGEAVIGDAIIPTGAIATKLGGGLYAGLAVYAPFGFNSSYDDTSVARYHGTFSQVVSGNVTAMVGLDLGGGWSIAGGPRLQYFNLDLEGAIDAAGIEAAALMSPVIPGTDDVFFDLSADDIGFGYALGMQGKLGDRLTFGVSFSSKVKHDLSGDATFDLAGSTSGQTLLAGAGLFQDTGVSTSLTTPATIQFGARLEVTDRSRLMVSAAQTRWKSFDALTVSFDNPFQPAETTTQEWDNAWTVAVGGEKDFGRAHTVRLGLMYEQDPVNPDFASPRVPGADRLMATAGYSTKLSERATLHLAAAYVVTDANAVNEPASYPENTFRGSYSGQWNLTSIVGAVGVDWKF
ncbi:MAG: outer membrane protein transport protein [Parvularculaceae bacterium]